MERAMAAFCLTVTTLCVVLLPGSGSSAAAPPYPVFPKDFVGFINITTPGLPPTKNWMAVRGSKVGRRQIHQIIYYQNYSYSYLIFDHAPNPRPGSRSANHTVIIAEDGNLPPGFSPGGPTEPRVCEYGTYVPAWMTLPVGFGQVIGYGGFECSFQGGACVPSDLQYSSEVTLEDGRRAHQWNKTTKQMFLTHYFFYTDVKTNLPVAAHAWMYSPPHVFNVSFNTQCSFELHPGNPPDSSFTIREGEKWADPETCKDRDLGMPGISYYIQPNRIFAANSTTDDCFKFVIGDKPWQGNTHVSLHLTDSKNPFRTPNCTVENPCVAIQPTSLTFTPDNWVPQVVCLHYIRAGISVFGFRISGGGYNFTTGTNEMIVYTCEHGHTGLDGCNM